MGFLAKMTHVAGLGGVVLSLLFVVNSASAEEKDRSKNSAPKVKSFPRSTNPAEEKKIKAQVKTQPPFSDKDLRKLSLTKPWSGYKSETWKQTNGDLPDKEIKKSIRHCEITVGVFDSENKKCWFWPGVDVWQEKGDSDLKVGELPIDTDIKEIDCGLLK